MIKLYESENGSRFVIIQVHVIREIVVRDLAYLDQFFFLHLGGRGYETVQDSKRMKISKRLKINK